MQAADDAGLTGIHYVAAADGAQEAYDYINGTTECKSGEYYCTGENSPWQVAITATNIAKEILVDGKDADRDVYKRQPVWGVTTTLFSSNSGEPVGGSISKASSPRPPSFPDLSAS